MLRQVILSKMDKKNIEDIYPLTATQQSMLFHYLQPDKSDRGFLQLRFSLVGSLNLELLKKAWQQVLNRHTALRTAVFWEELDKPMQIVFRQVEVPWKFEDWREFPLAEQQKRLELFYDCDRKQGINLSKVPVMRIATFQLSDISHQFAWSCHHLLLDGWSGALVLRNVFESYMALNKKQELHGQFPSRYREYVTWLKNQNPETAKRFWRTELGDFTNTNPLQITRNTLVKNDDYLEQEITLPSSESVPLKAFFKKQHLTLNTAVLASWALVLRKLSHSNDVIFGITVSGRPDDIPRIDSMVGLFVNLIPFRFSIPREISLKSLLLEIQGKKGKLQPFEYNSLAEIQEWSGVSGRIPLLQSIVAFENYPLEGLLEKSDGTLEIRNFKGGVTTNFPLTLMVKPADEISVRAIYNGNCFSSSEIEGILKKFRFFLNEFSKNPEKRVQDFLISDDKNEDILSKNIQIQANKSQSIANSSNNSVMIPPRDELELKLTRIWEHVLGKNPISIQANWFDLGGNSLLIASMISRIEESIGCKVELANLFQAPTIEGLANKLRGNVPEVQSSSLVPVQTEGTKPPFFFYGVSHAYSLANHLGSDQPVYGLIPKELENAHSTEILFKQIAAEYVDNILKLNPHGPYALGGYCWGGMLAYEISQQLLALGKEVSLLAIVSLTFPIPKKAYISYIIRRRMLDHIRNFVRLDNSKKMDFLRDDILRGINDKIKLVYRRLRKNNPQKRNSGQTPQGSPKKNLEANFDGTANYHPQPYSRKTMVIYTAENPIIHDDDPRLNSWRKLVTGDLKIKSLPGKYARIFNPPHVQTLGRELRDCLNEPYPMN